VTPIEAAADSPWRPIMARRKSLEQTHRGFNTGPYATTLTPEACPVCSETPEPIKGQKSLQTLTAHIMQHRPDAPCPHEHRSDVEVQWKLDWDAVVHANPQFSLWYCSECGFYLKA
jgi:hypothetical protein